MSARYRQWRWTDDDSPTDDCRPECASRKSPNNECVCAELDAMGVPVGMTIDEWFRPENFDLRRRAERR